MALRLRHKATLILSEDKDGKNKLFAPDDTLAEVVLDGYTEQSSGNVGVLASGTFNVPFGGIADARGCFLRADNNFALTINGAAVPIQVKLGVAAAGGVLATSARVFLEAGLTSITVVAGASPIALAYVVWGDPLS